jgi:hypothetical protein
MPVAPFIYPELEAFIDEFRWGGRSPWPLPSSIHGARQPRPLNPPLPPPPRAELKPNHPFLFCRPNGDPLTDAVRARRGARARGAPRAASRPQAPVETRLARATRKPHLTSNPAPPPRPQSLYDIFGGWRRPRRLTRRRPPASLPDGARGGPPRPPRGRVRGRPLRFPPTPSPNHPPPPPPTPTPSPPHPVNTAYSRTGKATNPHLVRDMVVTHLR